VRALSVRQPWCELIARGRKSIEVRTWRTDYRGPLLIVASMNVERDFCRKHGIDPKTTARGVAVCVVELADVRPILRTDSDEAAFNVRDLVGDAFAWELASPRRVVSTSIKGKLSLFNVDDAMIVEM
jgi:hypothetical protein